MAFQTVFLIGIQKLFLQSSAFALKPNIQKWIQILIYSYETAELRGSEAGASTSGSLGRSATRAEKMVTFEDDLKSIATATNASATATLSGGLWSF